MNSNSKSSFQSIGTSASSLEDHLISSGYWAGAFNRGRNAMVLTPSAYHVTRETYEELSRIGRETYSALERMSREIYEMAHGKTQTRESQQLIGMMTRASKGLLTPQMSLGGSISPVIKVDLVQDVEGKFQIAEVDAYNPRGLGFNALLDGLATCGAGCDNDFATFGTIKRFAEIVREHFGGATTVGMIVSEFERYYGPSFEILQRALADNGITLVLLSEGSLFGENLDEGLSMCDGNLIMIPESLNDLDVRSRLLDSYLSGNVQLLYPPTAYLGSKLLLPHLRKCGRMNKYIPQTFHVSRYHEEVDVSQGQWVLKLGQSSGMKSVFFSDCPNFADRVSEQSTKKRAAYVLQSYVEQKAQSLEVYDTNGKSVERQEYFRFIATVTRDGIIGLDITGRPDRAVHGARDCTMIPSILV